MCGHVGIAGKMEFKDEMTMKRLFLYDYFRGPDSTGLASLRKDGSVRIAKVASNPINLFDMQRFKDALSGYNSTVLLGHNRAATKGAVNDLNAHPYQYDHIVGAHNGTLDKSSWDALNNVLGYKTDVDSQAIFACIAKIGIEETVKLLRGAWALVWIDTSDNSLNFLRNKERSFWYAYDDKFDRVFWASEYPFIQAAVKLSAQSYTLAADKEGHTFFSTLENWWYKYDIKAFGSLTERPKPRVKELKGKEAAAYTASPFHDYRGSHTAVTGTTGTVTHPGSRPTQTTSSSTTTSKTGTPLEYTVRNYVVDKTNPFAGYLSEERFTAMAKSGCSWCSKTVDYDEVGLVIDDRLDTVLCSGCSGSHNHTRIYVTGDLRDLSSILDLTPSTALTVVNG